MRAGAMSTDEKPSSAGSPGAWETGQGAALGALAGALHAVAIATVIGWHFRDNILAPPLVGHVQLFDPASKLLGFILHMPAEFLQHFYAPGLVAKAPLVLEVLTANVLLGAALGLVLTAGLRWLSFAQSAFGRTTLFGLGFLSLSALLHLAALIPVVVDPRRPRTEIRLLKDLARRMVTDGPAVDLGLTAGALVVAFWLGRRLRPRWGLRASTVATLAAVALIVIGNVDAHHRTADAGGRPTSTVAAVRPRNVLLISIDSLRADHVGSYGYRRQTSPIIDRLATEGVRFATAYASSSWTLPSHATMLTGRYPLSHGAISLERPLLAATPTLATVLGGAGYATGGFVSYEFLRRRYGFDAGFDYFDDFTTDLPTDEEERNTTTGPLLNAQIVPWVEANKDRPFFLFVHYYDVHFNYDPPPPYDTMFDPDYEGPDLRRFLDNPAIHPGMPKRHLEQLIALYDGEIRLTDAMVGEVVETVDRLGIGDETLLIVTSDHGDEFFEHGDKGHQKTLYDEVLKVPLVMRWPAALAAGQTLEIPVSQVDLAPTIYDVTAVQPPPGLEGRTLAPMLFGKPDRPTEIYAHLCGRTLPKNLVTVRRGTEKYLQNLSMPRAEFYDLDVDPGEKLSRTQDARARVLTGPLLGWLRQQWDAHRALPSAGPQVALDSRNIEQLKALGYLD